MRVPWLLWLIPALLLAALTIFPARAAPNPQATPLPTPTYKACHICGDDILTEPVVHAVLFWMNGCPHCHHVLEEVLPPLKEKYGAQLQIHLIEIVGLEDFNRLYEVAAVYGIPKKDVAVPFLIIGEHILIGSKQIPEQLPGLIEAYLAQGGVDWPPGLAPQPEEAAIPTETPDVAPGAVVRAILFTTLDCQSCQIEAGAALTPVWEKYGAQFEMRTIDIITPEDVEYLYRVAAGYGIPREQVDLPLLIIGNEVLIGEQSIAELSNLVASYLAAGGVDWPAIPTPREAATPALTQLPPDAPLPWPEVEGPNGFTLAIVVMIGMAAALLYSLIAFALGKTFPLPGWADWLIPAFIIIGIGVAGYLSYVETQSVEAVCGPVGNCNTVQQSRYAKVFDILPVGVLGLLGYLALLAAWLVRKFLPKLQKPAAIGFLGMAFFAVIFSLYLTYLEPFVIKAVCLWCITSAVLVTLLLLLGLPPAIRLFSVAEEDE